jgi:two-component system NtrC family sensor kinase
MAAAMSAARRSALIVEDDTAIREVLEEVLRTEQYETATCRNGREALERLRRGSHPDVIVLDLMMPVMDGWEFRVEQRKDPSLATIPIVALSADRTSKAAAIDADAYVKKPVDFDTLVGTISRVVLARENRDLHARRAESDRLIALGTLAAGLAHEINNPLAYVILNATFAFETLPRLLEGAADRFESANLATTMLAALDAIRSGTERIRAVVHGLKMFSRPEHDSIRAVDVHAALDAVLPMLTHEIEPRARLEKEYGRVPYVLANEAKLGQVFLNLLLNAVQSLPAGRANTIRIRTEHVPPDVVVEVHDTGCGIPDDVRSRVFEPFFTTKPVGVGTGLGLPICYGIVRALGGELTFDTEVGRGTVFRVRLPAAREGDGIGRPGSF